MIDNGFKKKRTANGTHDNWQWVISIVMIVLVTAAACFFTYKKPSPIVPFVSSYVTRLKIWITERKAHLHQSIVQAKRLDVNKNEVEHDIHFEFYTALPSMQVTIPDRNAQDNRQLSSNTAIVSVDQLEQELSEEFNNTNHKRRS